VSGVFDNIRYWRNRKAGKRGQDEHPNTKKRNDKLSKPASTRKEQRKKIRDPKHTGKSKPNRRHR
jgi:hypothetical protein